MNLAEELRIESRPSNSSSHIAKSRNTGERLHRSGIYLDFEGEGKKRDKTFAPLAHLAGVYRPQKTKSSGGDYTCYFFRKSWTPVKNGCLSKSEITEFNHFLRRLVDEAKSEMRTIYYWSNHELAVIENFASPELVIEFRKVSKNSLSIAKKFASKRRIEIGDEHSKGLNNFLSALAPNMAIVEETKVGAAESCRRLDSYCTKVKRWRRWTDRQKDVAKMLVSYNYDDCVALYRMTKKCLRTCPKWPQHSRAAYKL